MLQAPVIAMFLLAALALPAGTAAASETADTASAFLTLEEIRTPIIDSSSIDGVIRVKLAIEPADSAAAALLTLHLPLLRAAALAAVIEYAHLEASGFKPVNSERLRAGLTRALQRVTPGVGKVLILEVGAFPS
ncbi:hypothetical protein [Iodidimonas sp. SYSU 1G8]|uniref:hypothetical protein n=1 Tax=Iodidimonas sp. SYSU 1G8 TaxID=3133967 RepID=UPI0031FF3A2F